MQKIRLALRGWSRRRQERDAEFLAKNAWNAGGGEAPSPVAARGAASPVTLDFEGINVAYLDGSGRTTHYLDVQTGDVLEATNVSLDAQRFKRIPSASHEDDRLAFIESLKDDGQRSRLAAADSFRAVLAKDRALERSWYNFRNDRALNAINRWLREIGLR